MKVLAIRTAMCGGGLSYDVYVPIEEIPHYDGTLHTTILRDGKSYWSFENATLPVEHYSMPTGWDRYQAYLDHEKRARVQMLAIIRSCFVEAERIIEPALPSLWSVGLLPRDQEASAEQWLTIDSEVAQ